MKRILTVLLMLMAGSLPAWAALGGTAASVESDAQVLGGQHKMIAKVGYNLHQITRSDGSVVNEFVSPAGVVFGVSWQGHSLPNFSQVLGAHLSDFQNGQRTNVVPRRAVTIQTGDFVLISIGHDRYFRGRAFVRSQIPSNLTPEVVQ
ncbi:MAG TPA: DUF2844 domain-containing protein [Verrucomicrobiae bacterium]|nr:DUF2844 domain-containing protein [Verrucomicrobiae bacterium]